MVDKLGSKTLACNDCQQDTIPGVPQRPGFVIGSRRIQQFFVDYL
ncbi:hypothetical protein [Sphingomonas endolithica]|nr:hypothetical protein [Sphingomonas sp. ZFBP2030]